MGNKDNKINKLSPNKNKKRKKDSNGRPYVVKRPKAM